MYSIQKIGGLSLIAAVLALPGMAVAAGDTKVASKSYVDETTVAKNQGAGNSGKVLKINASGIVEPGDAVSPEALEGSYVKIDQGTTNKNKFMVTGNDGKVTPAAAADVPDLSGTYVKKAQGIDNANMVLKTDGDGNVYAGNLTTTIDESITTNAGSGDAYVVNSVTADGNIVSVTKGTVKIPVSAGAPSTNTPTGYSEIWVQ